LKIRRLRFAPAIGAFGLGRRIPAPPPFFPRGQAGFF